MNLTLEIVPGESIGPFRLGMHPNDIKQALQSLQVDVPPTLESLGIVAWSRGDDGGWRNAEEEGKCERLGVRVYNNDHSIVLLGREVNNISNEDAVRLFESFAAKIEHSYGGFDAPDTGISAVRWEHSDPWIDSIFVFAPEVRSA